MLRRLQFAQMGLPSHFILRPAEHVSIVTYVHHEVRQSIPRQNWQAIGVRLGVRGEYDSPSESSLLSFLCDWRHRTMFNQEGMSLNNEARAYIVSVGH